jgi:chromate transporter
MTESKAARLKELAALFVRLGFTAFGGPAAHIAMLRDEVVARRDWLTDEEFLDLLGATNLIPGPNSTEMCLHIGHRRAGLPGLLVAGAGFILPAAGMVLALAWAYGRWGSLPEMEGLLYGVKPVAIAIVAAALWELGRRALRTRAMLGIAAAALALYALLGWNEILLLGLAGLTMLALRRARLNIKGLAGLAAVPALFSGGLATTPNLLTLFLILLKIGSVLYGSGYVLLAFLRADFVLRLGWLSDAQLIDAVAVGQVTPGPVFTTATFVGYLIGGAPGAALATAGIFLPSFAFVLATNRLVPRLRESAALGALLDGVNATSLALMAAVTLHLGRAALVDGWTLGLAAAALFFILRYKVNSTWLVLGGLAFGLARAVFQ